MRCNLSHGPHNPNACRECATRRKRIHVQPAYSQGSFKLMVHGRHVGTFCEAFKGTGKWLADVARPDIGPGRALCIGLFESAHAACRSILQHCMWRQVTEAR